MNIETNIFLLIMACAIVGCKPKTPVNSDEVASSYHTSNDTLKQDKTAGVPFRGIEKIMNTSLPFGSSLLIEHKFPEAFKIANVVSGDTGTNIHQQKLEEVSVWYSKVNQSEACSPPAIADTIYLNIPVQSKKLRIAHAYVKSSLDSFRFKLPGVSKYQCYYSYERSCGNLILYDTALKAARVLPIYYEGEGEFETLTRYFFITKEFRIKIFEERCGEESCGIRSVSDITIGENGEIQISEVFKN
jgi:hypothetical protein